MDFIKSDRPYVGKDAITRAMEHLYHDTKENEPTIIKDLLLLYFLEWCKLNPKRIDIFGGEIRQD